MSEKMKAKAEETKAKEIQRRKEYFQQFLLEGEVIESLYPVGADSLAMTEWRLLFVEEFNTDKSRVLITLPYSQIVEVKMVLGEMYSFSNKVYVATRSETHEFAFPKFIKEEEVKEFYLKLMQKIRQMGNTN